MSINWPLAQGRLGVKPDGYAGPVTYAALVTAVAGVPVALAHDLGAGLSVHLDAYAVDTSANRLAGFLGQCCHESGGFRYMQEIGGTAYFTKLYEGRANLGNTQPGDGARFHGRGLIQLTGRANYASYGKALGLDLIGNPDIAANPTTAVLLALEYWNEHGLNALADKADWTGITKRINGGTNGLASRLNYITRALKVLA